VGQPGNGRGRPMITRTRAQVNPAAPERSSDVLPWEIFACLRLALAKAGDDPEQGGGNVA